MRLTDEAQGAVEFGRFRLLPHRRELHADGAVVELGGRAFDVLMVLSSSPTLVHGQTDCSGRWLGGFPPSV